MSRDDYIAAFQSHTTRVGFKLVMTQPMMEFLCAVADDAEWDRRKYGSICYPDNFLATEHALTRRGLIRRKPPVLSKKQVKADQYDRSFCELTPVGEAVVAMMKAGGIFIECEIARERLSRRKGRL